MQEDVAQNTSPSTDVAESQPDTTADVKCEPEVSLVSGEL